MMLKGKYIFRSNGEILFEGENIITSNGAYMINRYLTNSSVDWAGSIAVGALGTTSASTDTRLGYEIYRTPITLKSYLTSSGSNQLALKATLEPTLVAQIYEVGIFPLNHVVGAYKDNLILTNFDEVTSQFWNTGSSLASASTATLVSTNSRSGAYNVNASATSFTTRSGFSFNLSNYNTNDFVELLYYVPVAGTSPSLTITFTDTSSLTWVSTTNLLPTTSSGYYTASLAMSNNPATGFNYNINSITLQMAGGTGSVQYDCLKFMSGATKPPELKLVSRRSSSSALITKTSGQSVDIEYYLTVM